MNESSFCLLLLSLDCSIHVCLAHPSHTFCSASNIPYKSRQLATIYFAPSPSPNLESLITSTYVIHKDFSFVSVKFPFRQFRTRKCGSAGAVRGCGMWWIWCTFKPKSYPRVDFSSFGTLLSRFKKIWGGLEFGVSKTSWGDLYVEVNENLEFGCGLALQWLWLTWIWPWLTMDLLNSKL